MRLAVILIFAALLAQGATVPPPLVSSKKATAAASCPGSPSLSHDGTTYYRSWGAGFVYAGLFRWTDGGTPRTICKLEFEIEGNATGYDLVVEVHAVRDIYNLNTTVLATSANITGQNWATPTWVGGELTSPYTTTASAEYCLIIRTTSAMGGNDMGLYGQGGTALTGYADVAVANGDASNASGDDPSIRIYWQ